MNRVTGKFLQQLSDLASFPLSHLDQLADNLTVKDLKKNELLFDQGEEARLVYILLSGVVRLSFFNSDDGQTIVSLLPAGEFFGLDSLTPKTRHPFRCEAFEDCSTGAVKPQTLVEILLRIPYESFLRWHLAAMYPGQRMFVHCVKRIGMDLRKRLGLELLNLADRFGTQDARGVVIGLAISHEVLAGLVGASRQQVTQYLNEFDREKIILREGRRIIIKVDKLRRILD
jgi:CRP-like cAMP-binding protein